MIREEIDIFIGGGEKLMEALYNLFNVFWDTSTAPVGFCGPEPADDAFDMLVWNWKEESESLCKLIAEYVKRCEAAMATPDHPRFPLSILMQQINCYRLRPHLPQLLDLCKKAVLSTPKQGEYCYIREVRHRIAASAINAIHRGPTDKTAFVPADAELTDPIEPIEDSSAEPIDDAIKEL